MIELIHSCYRVAGEWFACEACGFNGDLKATIAHIVKHQFVVSR